MKKNMFSVIKVTAIITVLLTTCNIGFCKAENIKTATNVIPYFNYQTINNNKVEEIDENEELVINDEVIDNVENSNDVMSEVNDVNPYVEPEPTPVVETPEPVQTNIYYNDSYPYQVLSLINQIRRENGLSELTMNYTLIQIANIRAEEATRNWSHTRPDGTNWWTLHQQYGLYGRFGENLAYGQDTPEEVVQAWMDSEGHRANILNPEFNQIGISAYNNDGIYYWSQEFSN